MTGRTLERRVKLTDRLATKVPRKLLAIDGGGIRGVLSLMILNKMEKLLIEESKREDYRLADYFDYVSGTSTGGIITAGIAMGMSVEEILAFYVNNGAKMFDKASIFRRLQTKFESEPLALQLKSVFGEPANLGAPEIRGEPITSRTTSSGIVFWRLHLPTNLRDDLVKLAKRQNGGPIFGFPAHELADRWVRIWDGLSPGHANGAIIWPPSNRRFEPSRSR
jgi:Patatin-like phospholipase